MFYLRILLTFVIAGSGVAISGDIPKEAFDTWREAGINYGDGQLVWEASIKKREADGKMVQSPAWGTACKKGNKLFGKLKEFDSEGKMVGETIEIRNDKGVYVLSKPVNSQSWMLNLAEPKDQRKEDLISEQTIRQGFTSQYRFASTSLFLVVECKDAKFSDWEEFIDQQGRPLARFNLVTVDNLECHTRAGKYEIVVDPTHQYRLVQTTITFDEGKGRSITNYKYNSENIGMCCSTSEQVSTDIESGLELYRNSKRTVSFTSTPPSDEIFELSHYGLRDVVFASQPSYFWFYAVCTAIALLLLLFYFRSRQKMARNTH